MAVSLRRPATPDRRIRYANSVPVAPLDRCAELLGVDLVTVREAATNVKPYIRPEGAKVWSLTQLERQLRTRGVFGRRRSGSIDRRRTSTADT